MLRASLGLILLAAAAVVLAAQSKAEPDAAVVSFDWKYAGYVRAETIKEYEPTSGKKNSDSYSISRKTVYVFKYTARAFVKNTGAKTIKAISWDYVFTDKTNEKEVKRVHVQSKQQIPPGESATLQRDVGLDPKEDARQINESKQSVEINRIEYADGSTWRKPERQ